MLLKVDCLPNAVGKQPSIPLIYLRKKMDVKLMMMMMMMMTDDDDDDDDDETRSLGTDMEYWFYRFHSTEIRVDLIAADIGLK